MKTVLKITYRLSMTLPVFIIFGLYGLMNLWRYGGGLSVNKSMELNSVQALEIMEATIEKFKEAQKNLK